MKESDSQSTINTNKDTKKRKSTKHFVDNKREKLQKGLTQKARQEILLKHSQKQLDIQEKMLEAINKKDQSIDVAIKSMAESTTMVCNRLATVPCRRVAHGASTQETGPRPHLAHAGVVVQPQYTQYGHYIQFLNI